MVSDRPFICAFRNPKSIRWTELLKLTSGRGQEDANELLSSAQRTKGAFPTEPTRRISKTPEHHATGFSVNITTDQI